MKKVLIAIDYSPGAQKVAETGYEYARSVNAEILIVHAIADSASYSMECFPVMGFNGFGIDGPFADIEEQKNEAAVFLSCVARHLGGRNIKTSVLQGRVSDAILQCAGKWKADLIVMGAPAPNYQENVSLGKVASTVLRQSRIPLLLIPTENYEFNIEGISHYTYLQV